MPFTSKRTVHLDFHTSHTIKDIAKNFNKENFQTALKEAHVESITVFAKCHNGYCYYPTKVGTVHPGLKEGFDFTKAMIDAAHEIGVKVPVYITAGFSHLDAETHQEWVAKENGELKRSREIPLFADPETPKPNFAWWHMCLNDGSYAQHIYDLTEEICTRYNELDGLFYDICVTGAPCYCDECVEGMRKMGLNPESKDDAMQYYILKRQAFMEKCRKILYSHHPNATIFFNSGGADIDKPQYHEYQSHFEMEDLPTAWGGYNKLPLRAKYFQKLGKPYIGMTGKFHLDWGEFGGFKSKEALKYEICSMSLYGAGASIGDHMHPDGEMDMTTYKNIGYAYSYMEKIAPYCYDGTSCASVGVFLSNDKNANQGLSNILCEAQIDFDIVFNNNFDAYSVVIFPDGCVLDKENEDAINKYLKNGGKALFMGDSAIKDDKFIFDCGANYVGKCQYDCDYLCIDENAQNVYDIPQSPVLCSFTSHHVSLTTAKPYAWVSDPYFSRAYGHFCGHKNTPNNKQSTKYAGIIKNDNIVYVAHPLSTLYNEIGAVAHKYFTLLALDLILPKLPFRLKIGSQGRATMLKQEQFNRYCLNMTYASPVKRGIAEIIEDIIPIYNIPVCINVPEEIKRVFSAVDNTEIPFNKTENGIEFIVPKLECHNIVVLEY